MFLAQSLRDCPTHIQIRCHEVAISAVVRHSGSAPPRTIRRALLAASISRGHPFGWGRSFPQQLAHYVTQRVRQPVILFASLLVFPVFDLDPLEFDPGRCFVITERTQDLVGENAIARVTAPDQAYPPAED